MDGGIKKNEGYRAYRKRQKRALLLYIIINLIIGSILLQIPANDTVTLVGFLFTAAVLVSLIGFVKKPQVSTGVVTGKETGGKTGRTRYFVLTGQNTLTCSAPDGTDFETGEEVYVIQNTDIIKTGKT